MLDRGQRDDKVLAVPATDPLFDGYQDLSDIPSHFLHEVAHFFEVYKDPRASASRLVGNRLRSPAEIERAIGLFRTASG